MKKIKNFDTKNVKSSAIALAKNPKVRFALGMVAVAIVLIFFSASAARGADAINQIESQGAASTLNSTTDTTGSNATDADSSGSGNSGTATDSSSAGAKSNDGSKAADSTSKDSSEPKDGTTSENGDDEDNINEDIITGDRLGIDGLTENANVLASPPGRRGLGAQANGGNLGASYNELPFKPSLDPSNLNGFNIRIDGPNYDIPIKYALLDMNGDDKAHTDDPKQWDMTKWDFHGAIPSFWKENDKRHLAIANENLIPGNNRNSALNLADAPYFKVGRYESSYGWSTDTSFTVSSFACSAMIYWEGNYSKDKAHALLMTDWAFIGYNKIKYRNLLGTNPNGWQELEYNNGLHYCFVIIQRDVSDTLKTSLPQGHEPTFMASWSTSGSENCYAKCTYMVELEENDRAFYPEVDPIGVDGKSTKYVNMLPPFSGFLQNNNGSTMNVLGYCGQYSEMPIKKKADIPEGDYSEDSYRIQPCVYKQAYYARTEIIDGKKRTTWHAFENIKHQDDGWYCNDHKVTDDSDISVILVYSYNSSYVTPPLEKEALNVEVDFFDYDVWYNNGGWGNGQNGFNDGHSLKFIDGANSISGYNAYGENVYKDIVSHDLYDNTGTNKINDRLVKGFPKLKDRNESLSYCFDLSKKSEYRKDYSNIYGLFDKNIYESSGTYYFNSKNHFAQIRKDSDKDSSKWYEQRKSLVLYTTPRQNDSNNKYFMPWDDKVSPGDRCDSDFHFGMTMSTRFIQPEGGINPKDKSNMTFEFNGDDDVWVFVDGKLVLDLGGIHLAKEGKIDFASGNITGDGCPKKNDREVFSKLSEIFGSNDSDADKYEFDRSKGRFKDGSVHMLQFFYLERGSNQSNCKLTFNLQTLPPEPFVVGKEVDSRVDNSGSATYDNNRDYYFRVDSRKKDMYKESGSDYFSWARFGELREGDDANTQYYYSIWLDPECTSKPYKEKNSEGKYEQVVYPALPGGVIKLKEGQYAQLIGLSKDDQVRVVECDYYEEGEGSCRVDNKELNSLYDYQYRAGSSLTKHNAETTTMLDLTGKGTTDKLLGCGTNYFKVGTDSCIFTNKPKNLFDLKIKKRGNNSSTSAFQLLFNNGTHVDKYDDNEYVVPDGSDAAYSGTYDVLDSSGEYVETKNIKLIGNKDTDYEKKYIGWKVFELKDGQTAVVHNVQMGMMPTTQAVLEKEAITQYGIEKYEDSMTDNYPGGPMIKVSSYPEYKYDDTEKWYWANQKDFVQYDDEGKENIFTTKQKIPILNTVPADSSKRFAEIDFLADTVASDLVLKKTVDKGTDKQKSDKYEMSVLLFENGEVYNPGDVKFEAGLVKSGQTESKKYDATINSDGMLLIDDPNDTSDSPHMPVMENGDKLTVKSIVLSSDFAIKAVEKNCNGLWYPNVKFTGKYQDGSTVENTADMTVDYEDDLIEGKTHELRFTTPDAGTTVDIHNDFIGNDLLVSKKVEYGNTLWQNSEFALSVLLYNDFSCSDAYVRPDDIYDAQLTVSGSSTPVNYQAKIGDCGEIVIRQSSSEEWELPKLKNGDQLKIIQVLPDSSKTSSDSVYMCAYEKNVDAEFMPYWMPYSGFNNDSTVNFMQTSWDYDDRGYLKKGMTNNEGHETVNKQTNEVEIVNRFSSSDLYITKEVGNGSRIQKSQDYYISALLYTDRDCTHELSCDDFEFDAVKTLNSGATKDYVCKVVDGALLFREKEDTSSDFSLIALKHEESITVKNVLPTRYDESNPASYFKSFEKVVNANNWYPYSLINSIDYEAAVPMSEDYTVSGVNGLTVLDSDAGASLPDITNALLVANQYSGINLSLEKIVDGGESSDFERAYHITAILSTDNTVASGTYTPYITDTIYDATFKYANGKSKELYTIVGAKGQILVSESIDGPYHLPEIKTNEEVVVHNIVPEAIPDTSPVTLYGTFYEQNESDVSSDWKRNVTLYDSAGSRSLSDDVTLPFELDTLSSGVIWGASLKLDNTYNLGINRVEVHNQFAGNNLTISKKVINGSNEQLGAEYPATVSFFSTNPSTFDPEPYVPTSLDTVYDAVLYKDYGLSTQSSVQLNAKLVKCNFEDETTSKDTILLVSPKDTDNYAIPKLQNNDMLLVNKIIPQPAASEYPLTFKVWEQDFVANNWEPSCCANGGRYDAMEASYNIKYNTGSGDVEVEGKISPSRYDCKVDEDGAVTTIAINNTFKMADFTVQKMVIGTEPEDLDYYNISAIFTDASTNEPIKGADLGSFDAEKEEADGHKILCRAYITNDGELVINDSVIPETQTIEAADFVKLKNGEKLTVKNIIPAGQDGHGAWKISSFETRSTGFWNAYSNINGEHDKQKMSKTHVLNTSTPTIPKINRRSGYTNSVPVETWDDPNITNTMTVINEYITPSGFDILKHPELLFLLLFSVFALLSIIPAKLALKRKAAGKDVGPVTFIDTITGLFTEDFDL